MVVRGWGIWIQSIGSCHKVPVFFLKYQGVYQRKQVESSLAK